MAGEDRRALVASVGGVAADARDIARDVVFFFFSSRRRHTRLQGDWSSDVCSSDLTIEELHSVKSRALTGWDGGTMYALNADGESVYVISPTTVFNVGGSYGSIHDDYYAPNVEIHSGDLASFWPSGWYTPYIKDLPQIYYPALNIGDASIGHGFYWIEHPKNASFRAKLSHIQRKHEMKFGLQYRRQFGLIQYPDLADFNFGPELTADT